MMDARAYNEQIPHKQLALSMLREGRRLTTWDWGRITKPGARLPATIEVLINGHGFTILGHGPIKDPYYMPDTTQMPTRVLTTEKHRSAYLHTDHWKDVSARRKDKDGRCLLCDGVDNLECHHIHYDTLFQENLRDLMTVCRPCHRRIHDAAKMRFPIGMLPEHVRRCGLPVEKFDGWLTAGASAVPVRQNRLCKQCGDPKKVPNAFGLCYDCKNLPVAGAANA